MTFFSTIRGPLVSPRTVILFPSTTLFQSGQSADPRLPPYRSRHRQHHLPVDHHGAGGGEPARVRPAARPRPRVDRPPGAARRPRVAHQADPAAVPDLRPGSILAIGRASWWERGCTYWLISVGAVSIKKKNKPTSTQVYI